MCGYVAYCGDVGPRLKIGSFMVDEAYNLKSSYIRASRSSNRGVTDIVRFQVIVTEQYLTLIALLP